MENITQILYYLYRIKSAHPHLRVGQIISNAISLNWEGGKTRNIFHITDKELLNALKNLYHELEQQQ